MSFSFQNHLTHQLQGDRDGPKNGFLLNDRNPVSR